NRYLLRSMVARPAACALAREQPVLFGLFRMKYHGTCENISVRLRDGDELVLSVLPPRSATSPERTDYTGTIVLFLVSVGFLAYLVARMTTRPLKQLAQAAKNLGNDINHAPLDLTGADEIRQASAAFNAMQARIAQRPRRHGAPGPSARPAPLPGQPDRQRGQVRPRRQGQRRPHQRRGAHPHPRRWPRYPGRRTRTRVRSVLPRRDLALARI